MEVLRMNYYFTGLLVLAFTILVLFVDPAYPRNEYLNDGSNTCSTGDVSVSIEQRDYENRYRHYDPTNNYNSPSDDKSIRLTYRRFLGSACTDEFKTVQQENMELKQQLELMKMCGRVNSNPSLANNENFRLLVSKCTGVTPVKLDNRPADGKSKWDDMKDDYKKENPEITLMGDKFLKSSKKKLIIPKYLTDEKIVLPLPKPKND
jgi:hypothetical protein